MRLVLFLIAGCIAEESVTRLDCNTYYPLCFAYDKSNKLKIGITTLGKYSWLRDPTAIPEVIDYSAFDVYVEG